MTEHIAEILSSGNHSLVIDNGKIHIFDGRGIGELFGLMRQEPSPLSGASVADKIVGKAAAAIMIAGGVSELYAATISRAAIDLLEASGIAYSYGIATDRIINRLGTGMCPMEELCADCKTVDECINALEKVIPNL